MLTQTNPDQDPYPDLQHLSTETLSIYAEIIKNKLIISLPERKIFSGRSFSENQDYCEGELAFLDSSSFACSNSDNDNNKYKQKIVVVYKTEKSQEMCAITKVLACKQLEATGCIILDEKKEIDDREEVLTYFHSLKEPPIPVLWLHLKDSNKFLQWVNLQLVLMFQGSPKEQYVLPHPFQEDDASHWQQLKGLLHDRKNWYKTLFGDLKPLNVTPIFDQYYTSIGKVEDVFNIDDKQNLVFLFVSGLYHGRFPGRQTSFQSSIDRMKEAYNLDFRYIEIDNDKGVLHNATIIASVITRYYKEMQKQIVVIGHSKGAVDISVAITLYPKIQKKIRLFLSLMSAFGGSPIASLCVYNHRTHKQEARVIVRKLIKSMLKCSTDALLDITLESRHNFLLHNPYPVQAVPTVSVIATRSPNPSLLSRIITKMYHEENDALITVTDAYIPGSTIIYVTNMDHRGPNGTNPPYNDTNVFFPSLIASSLLATSSQLLTRPLTLCKNENCCSIPFDHITITNSESYLQYEIPTSLQVVKENMSKMSPFLSNLAGKRLRQ